MSVSLAWTLLSAGCAESPAPAAQPAASAEAPAAGAAPSPAPPVAGDGARPNILFVDIDTWRADRLLREREGRPIAPTMAALTKKAFYFENAFTQGGWTMPGLASLVSGRHPIAPHSRNFDMRWLPPKARLLPDILAIYGYHTVFYGNEALAGSTLDTSQFQTVLPPRQGPDAWVRPLSDWIVNQGQEPFFAFLGDADMHMPRPPLPEAQAHLYSGPQPACNPAVPQSPQPLIDATIGALGVEAARQHAIDHYDAGVTAYDTALAGLLDTLQQRGLAERTVIVLTSNHGEELGEHGAFNHGVHWDTVLRVPLVVYDPRRSGGKSIDTMVQTIDVAPTLLDLAGIPVESRMDGQSLRPLMDGVSGYEERPVYSMSDTRTGSIRTREAKFLLHRDADGAGPGAPPPTAGTDAGKGIEAYYDLVADPGEQKDVAAEHPAEVAELRRRLLAWLEERASLSDESTPKADPALVERLKRDGYWQLVDAGGASGSGPGAAAGAAPGTAPGAAGAGGPPVGPPQGPPLGPDGKPLGPAPGGVPVPVR